MSLTIGTIDRKGSINFSDASLSIWEDGISLARANGGAKGVTAWERQFKREVFARIIQTLNRLGWTCTMPAISEHDIKHYGKKVSRWSAESKRFCVKGDLKADLDISGRCIELKMFQSVNCPTRPDHEGRYESNKEDCMPYLLRLEMERTRRRIRTYLLNVMRGYVFEPPRPVLGLRGVTALEYAAAQRRSTGHYVAALDRAQISNANRDNISADGQPLENGMQVFAKDYDGRIISGTAFYSLNGNWQVVTGRYAMTHVWHTAIWLACPGNPRVKRNASQRRKRLEKEMATAIEAMNFERALVLRNILFPNKPSLYAVRNNEHNLYHRTGFQGYTGELTQAGKFTADEVRGWDRAPNQVIQLAQGMAA